MSNLQIMLAAQWLVAEMPATVTVSRYFYVVEMGEGDTGSRHSVLGYTLECACALGANCPAVNVVRDHLAMGGEQTANPRPGYYPVAPRTCPICGAETFFDIALSSKNRGAGWRCKHGGKSHYWQDQGEALKVKFRSQPWLFPPVVIRQGQRMNAWDGVLIGDDVLDPGLLRSEILTFQEVSYAA